MIVADTNLVAALILPGGDAPAAEGVLAEDPDWVAPALWRSELANVLVVHIHRGALGLQDALDLMALAELRMRGLGIPVEASTAIQLAAVSGCTAYDCEFVALAQELEVPLVTADRQVLSAFPDLATSYAEFTAGR